MDFWHDAAAQKRWLRRLALLTGLLLVPVFVLAVFARPSADDFIYAARTYAVVRQYGFDLPLLLQAAWDTNVYYYENWQGLYVSGFTLAFQPAVFGNKWYGVTILCVLLPLFFCLYGLARCVVLRLAPAQKRLPWALAILLTFAFIEGMPAPVEGLYWFNGAMNYLPYFSLAVLNAGLAFALCFPSALPKRRQALYIAAGCVCSLVIGGGHQVTGLLNALVLLLAVVLCAKHRNFRQLPAFAAAVVGLLLNVLAPGTRVRTSGFSGAGFVEAVVKSFILAALEWIRWLDVPLLCLLVLLALPLLHLARSAALPDRVFRLPILGAAVTFVLMWGMIFLPSYTMGGIGAGRLLNVVWMTFVLGLAATEFLLLGWLERVKGVPLHGIEQFCKRHARALPAAAACMLVVMACIGSHTVKEGQDNYFATSLEAAYELADGQAKRYAAALDAREAVLTDAAQQDVTIRPLNDDERPWLLFYTDVAPGPDMWGLTPYFDKQSVTISDFS
ncbi:DUF6056 family protein [Gemmiger sp.]